VDWAPGWQTVEAAVAGGEPRDTGKQKVSHIRKKPSMYEWVTNSELVNG